ncbi:MAG: SIS domain-containing protein, partial [Candidatus Binatia bacterium]
MARQLDPKAALETARRVIRLEAEALEEIACRLTEDFSRAVDLILHCKGRVVVTGMGKSGQICRKIAATMSSTGTSAFFLHAGEAVHGDLGMFARGDVCIAVSNSGTTQEVLSLLPAVKRLSLPVIAITGGIESALAKAADVVLDARVRLEACPMNLAPTSSTTATLALGDALAVAVLEAKGFTDRDFAMLHPGGALGRRLLRVEEVMHPRAQVPLVATDASLAETLRAVTDGGLGTVGVIEAGDNGMLVGVITDGDVRRAVLR